MESTLDQTAWNNNNEKRIFQGSTVTSSKIW